METTVTQTTKGVIQAKSLITSAEIRNM